MYPPIMNTIPSTNLPPVRIYPQYESTPIMNLPPVRMYPQIIDMGLQL